MFSYEFQYQSLYLQSLILVTYMLNCNTHQPANQSPLYLSTVPKTKYIHFKPLTSNGIFLPFIINDVIREGNEVYFTFLHGYISFSSFNWEIRGSRKIRNYIPT